MLISKESLMKAAKEHGFKPENYEKVYRLLGVLGQFMQVQYLRERLVLKGGTALNIFHFPEVPRLSVDIDLNYIGQSDVFKMKEERSVIESAISDILMGNGFQPLRKPTKHAGGKEIWRYDSLLGQSGNLEIDLNYMFRMPLWPIENLSPRVGIDKSFSMPVLDIHELTAGKLSALFSRNASRDFFDAYYILNKCKLDLKKLRLSFVIYLAMTEVDVDSLSADSVNFDTNSIRRRLLPVLRQNNLPKTPNKIKIWANDMLSDLRAVMSKLLPLNKNEIQFINSVREDGEILPELITENVDLIRIVKSHPAILWSAQKASL